MIYKWVVSARCPWDACAAIEAHVSPFAALRGAPWDCLWCCTGSRVSVCYLARCSFGTTCVAIWDRVFPSAAFRGALSDRTSCYSGSRVSVYHMRGAAWAAIRLLSELDAVSALSAPYARPAIFALHAQYVLSALPEMKQLRAEDGLLVLWRGAVSSFYMQIVHRLILKSF